MNAVRNDDPDEIERRELLSDQLIARATDEVEKMRRIVPQLVKGDPAAWQEVRFFAQRMAVDARRVALGLLAACARELARITDEKLAGVSLSESLLLTTTAIETVALELAALKAAEADKPG